MEFISLLNTQERLWGSCVTPQALAKHALPVGREPVKGHIVGIKNRHKVRDLNGLAIRATTSLEGAFGLPRPCVWGFVRILLEAVVVVLEPLWIIADGIQTWIQFGRIRGPCSKLRMRSSRSEILAMFLYSGRSTAGKNPR
jgi:hypothetical protein